MSVFKIKEGYEPIHELFGSKKRKEEEKKNKENYNNKKDEAIKKYEEDIKGHETHIRTLESEIHDLDTRQRQNARNHKSGEGTIDSQIEVKKHNIESEKRAIKNLKDRIAEMRSRSY